MEMTTYKASLIIGGAVLAGAFIGIFLPEPRRISERREMIPRIEQIADLDGSGSLDNFEKLRVYEAIGKNPNLSIGALSNQELEAYLSSVKYGDTKNQTNYLKGDARENE